MAERVPALTAATATEVSPAEGADTTGHGARMAREIALLLGFWTLVGVVFAVNSFLARTVAGRPAPLWTFLAWMVPSWLFFAVATPAVERLIRRFPLDRASWRRSFPVLAAAGLAVTVLMALWDLLVLRTLGAIVDLTAVAGSYALRSDWELFRLLFAYDHPLALLVYSGIVAVLHALAFHRASRERDLVASRLEARLAVAHLDLLKLQLQPHFLFNTLHTISSLMHIDVEAADRTVAKLSDLLRMTIENGKAHEVPLKQEVDFTQGYLEIERTRFAERLAVEIDIDPLALDALVPSMILQPLVENAIRHGIGARSGGGRVRIAASALNGQLRLIVSDNGPGMAPAHAPGREGIGLANTRARLAQLYGADHRFLLQRGTGGGLQATLVIPLRITSDDSGESGTAAAQAASRRR